MLRTVLIVVAFLITGHLNAQDLSTFRIYHPDENAAEAIDKKVKQAKESNKHVLIQVGGNWCIWCARFHDLVTSDKKLDSVIKANYIVYHLNYSKENKNEKLLASYGFPQRFGFPVFLVLDGDGKLIHTQNSVYLEQDKGYDPKAVHDFLVDWSPAALDSARYKE